MKHLSELLERLNDATFAYRTANSSLDSNPLEVILAKEKLKAARFAWSEACSDYILEHVLKENTENVQLLSNV